MLPLQIFSLHLSSSTHVITLFLPFLPDLISTDTNSLFVYIVCHDLSLKFTIDFFWGGGEQSEVNYLHFSPVGFYFLLWFHTPCSNNVFYLPPIPYTINLFSLQTLSLVFLFVP